MCEVKTEEEKMKLNSLIKSLETLAEENHKTAEAFKQIREALEVCPFCSSGQEKIFCPGCGSIIAHNKRALSIGHLCFRCQEDMGKGE